MRRRPTRQSRAAGLNHQVAGNMTKSIELVEEVVGEGPWQKRATSLRTMRDSFSGKATKLPGTVKSYLEHGTILKPVSSMQSNWLISVAELGKGHSITGV